MKIVYVAEDGTEFNDKNDCITHEQETTLYGHIEKYCGMTFSDDSNSYSILPDDVTAYIFKNIDKINEFVKSSK